MKQNILHAAHGVRKITLSPFASEYDMKQRFRLANGKDVYAMPAEGSSYASASSHDNRGFSPITERLMQRRTDTLACAQKCIFVIDDSMTVQTIVEGILDRAGYEIKTFGTGIDALRYVAEEGARKPDLMLVDIGLPKVDGYEIIRMFKKRPELEHTVCIVLSRRDGLVDRLKGRLVGAHGYITKPFKTQVLLDVVQSYLTNEGERDGMQGESYV